MTAKEKLIKLILDSPPETIEALYKLMLIEDINPEEVATPRTVPQ